MSELGEFAIALDDRAQQIADACTQCGACFRACPMTEPAGIAGADPETTVGGILDLLAGGDGDSASVRWAETCSGSGHCISACPEAINPRFMMSLARLALARKAPTMEQTKLGQKSYATMTKSVRALSQIQLRPDVLSLFRTKRDNTQPDVVFYTGCNLLKTPHIALLCFDIMDRLDISYRVNGGPGDCCGVLQYRTGDREASGRLAYRTLDRFAESKAPVVLSWCPTCQVQLGENVLPGYLPQRPEASFSIEAFVVFLDKHLDRLRPHLIRRVDKRVGLHEHPGVEGVGTAAERILRAVPGVEFVDLAQPRVGWMCNTLQPMPAYKRSLHGELLQAAADANVTTLAGVYHACHREICSHERDWPFEIVNFLEIVGESMGIAHPDAFKRLKMMQDIDQVLIDVADIAAANGLDLEQTRDIIAQGLFGEQPLPLSNSSSIS
jgi:Fe-S oxidoreductase